MVTPSFRPLVRLFAMLSVSSSSSPITYLPADYDIGLESDQRVQITLLPENRCIEICYDRGQEFALCDFSSHSAPVRFIDSSVTLRDALKALGFGTDNARLTWCDIQDVCMENILDTPIRDIPLSQMDLDTTVQHGASRIRYDQATNSYIRDE